MLQPPPANKRLMPTSIQILLCIILGVMLILGCLLFYFKTEEASNRLAVRLWLGFLSIKGGLVNLAHKMAGANWRTTFTALGTVVFGILTVLSALPDQLGPIAEIVPPFWKANIIKVSLAATAVLHLMNGMFSKDRTVTGGSIIQDVGGKVAAIQPPVPASPAPALPTPTGPVAPPPGTTPTA